MNKPILFNQEMVQAIMDGRKTVTRRIVKGLPKGTHLAERNDDGSMGFMYGGCNNGVLYDGWVYKRLPCFIGDVLWVRETWKILDVMESASMRFEYLAGGKISDAISISAGRIEKILKFIDKKGWLPSLFMPREAARIFLRVTDVRTERLHEITEKQAKNEGVTVVTNNSGVMHRSKFVTLWNSTIKPADLDRYGWNANPFVWVISFERCEKPEDFV